MDWLQENAWSAWLAASILLVIGEMLSLELVLIMLAAGSAVGMAAALLGAPVVLQAVLALAAAVAGLALLRPKIRRRLHSGPDLAIGPQALIGRQAKALSRISALEPGLVRLAGEDWTAKPYDETVVIEPGATVDVLEIRGATALVHPVPSID